MFEKNEKNIFFTSVGYSLNELHKSFLLTFFYSLLFFGFIYISYIFCYILYLTANTPAKANIWFIVTIILSILTIIFLFVLLSRVKKIALLKITSVIANNNSLFKVELNNLNKLLDYEFSTITKEKLKRFFFFFIDILIEIVIAFGILGIYFVSTTLFWQILLFAILFFTLFPFMIFLFFWSLFCRGGSEITSYFSFFWQNYKLIMWILTVNVIISILLFLLNYILPTFSTKIYLISFISAFFFTLLCYFNFYCLSGIKMTK